MRKTSVISSYERLSDMKWLLLGFALPRNVVSLSDLHVREWFSHRGTLIEPEKRPCI